MELEYLSGLEIGELVNSGQLSPTEVVTYFLDRIEERNSSINAITYVMREDALRECKKLEARILAGENVGPLAGVPVGLKDFLPSKEGWINTHGGVPSLVAIDTSDSEFYKAARKLGAIAVGKTNAPPFGFSGACQNVMYGATKNPFDVSKTSGGSSGGSAAAVADGLIVIGEGGDAGGSIRIPAGWCNLFGFKPSIGTVPSYCRPDGWAATHPYCFNGSLTKTVADSATMLTAMANYNPRDPISLPINSNVDFVEAMKASMKGKKVAVTVDFDLYPVSTSMRATFLRAVSWLQTAGVDIDLVSFNWKHSLEEMLHCWCWSISLDSAIYIEQKRQKGLDLIADHSDELTPEFIKYNELASKVRLFDMRAFNEIRTDILDNFEDVLEHHDFIVSPTAACEPLPIEDNGYVHRIDETPIDPDCNFIAFGETPLVNFIGYPAASVPAGFSNGTPAGMQIIGRQYHDADVMALSYTLEQMRPWNYAQAFNRM